MLVLALVVLDQVSKFLVVSTMDLYESIPLLGDWLRITYIRNPGGAFGLRWGHVAVYYLAAALVIAWIVWHLWREGSTGRLSMWALALILAGALGNLVDRVLQGEVVDFIDCEFFDLAVPAFNLGILHHPGLELDRWPTFNVADSAVTIGVVALLVSLIRDPVVFAHPVAPAPEEPVAGHDVEESDHLPPASRTSA